MNQRVRFDWMDVSFPSAALPAGSRMPTVFPEGQSPLDSVLGGDAKTQSAAMWA